ncbi:MAG: SH3 domain-containing protein [Armatimonadetes bacterium]|nr:SH3 domain-containing protein [Anaerolineae bacterium]
MLYRTAFVVLVCCLFTSVNTALQTVNFLDLMPSDIFDASVEIRYTQASVEAVPYAYDNQLRVLALGGQVLPYPPSFDRVLRITAHDDQRFFIEHGIYLGTDYPQQYEVWQYDISTQTLTLFTPECGISADEAAYTGLIEAPWTIVNQASEWVLCNIITGERSSPLPADYLWIFETSVRYMPLVTISPDKTYVVFMGQIGLQPQSRYGRNIALFSYQPLQKTLIQLGELSARSSLYFNEWVDTQVTLTTGETDSIGSLSIYVMDASQPQSVAFAIDGRWPSFIDNPPRYVLGFDAPYGSTPCGRRTYDIRSRLLTELDLDGLCRPDYGSADGVGYYRDVPLGESFECCNPVRAQVATAPLIRYDSRTGERAELFSGELEQIYWVSADDRYAIVLVDANGSIDLFPYLREIDNNRLGFPYTQLIDLETDELLAATSGDLLLGTTSAYSADWGVNHGITPLADGTFIAIYCANVIPPCERNNSLAVRLTITNDATHIVPGYTAAQSPLVQETELVRDAIMVTPDKSGILVWSHPISRGSPPPTEQGINFYNLATGASAPLMQALPVERYVVEVQPHGDNALAISVDTLTQPYARGYYTLHFEADGRHYVEVQAKQQPAIDQLVCVLTTTTGVNLRSEPTGTSERVGTAEAGERLVAVTQTESEAVIWWQLQDQAWIHSDFVTASRACDRLLVVDE